MLLCISTDEEVKGGSIKVYVAYNKVPLFDQTLDLCELASMVGLYCPIASGMHTIKVSEQIPDFIPSVSLGWLHVILHEIIGWCKR